MAEKALVVQGGKLIDGAAGTHREFRHRYQAASSKQSMVAAKSPFLPTPR
jgi:hypothetical protein